MEKLQNEKEGEKPKRKENDVKQVTLAFRNSQKPNRVGKRNRRVHKKKEANDGKDEC